MVGCYSCPQDDRRRRQILTCEFGMLSLRTDCDGLYDIAESEHPVYNRPPGLLHMLSNPMRVVMTRDERSHRSYVEPGSLEHAAKTSRRIEVRMMKGKERWCSLTLSPLQSVSKAIEKVELVRNLNI